MLSAGLIAPPLAAQSFSRGGAAFGGFEARQYRFAAPLPVLRITQSAIPFGARVSYDRLTLDVGTYWAATALSRRDGAYRRVTGLTDTQVRAAWVFGRDVVVATLVLNLPTGLDRMAPADFDVLGAVSSAFLAFPVNAYANGASLTAAVAGVLPVEGWNLGLAGSIRGNRTFTPVVDPVAGPLNYRPGVEGRIRVGADRLVGQARLAVGVTASSFGDDTYAGLGTARGAYQPGTRWIGEAVAAGPAAGGTLSGTLWGYRRLAGDTAGVSLENAESLSGVTVSGAWPVAPSLDLEPGVEFRYSGVEGGRGLLVAGGLGARTRLRRGLTAWGGLRYDRGYLDAQSLDGAGQVIVNRTAFTAWSFSVLVRTLF